MVYNKHLINLFITIYNNIYKTAECIRKLFNYIFNVSMFNAQLNQNISKYFFACILIQ